VFQASLRTSRIRAAYRGIRIGNKSVGEGENSDDGRICSSASGEKQRSIGHRSGRFDRRDIRPFTSVHPVWMERATDDCGRFAWAGGQAWRCRHLYSWRRAALLYRDDSNGYLLRGKPQTSFFDGTSASLRPVLWNRGGTSNGLYRFAALRAPRQRSLRTPRRSSRGVGAHGGGWPTNFLQRPALRKIDEERSSGHTSA
jgi:hypothetical protein